MTGHEAGGAGRRSPILGVAIAPRAVARAGVSPGRQAAVRAGALASAMLILVAHRAAAQPEHPGLESCTRFGDIVVANGEVLDCNLSVIGGRLDVSTGGEVAGSANVPFGDAHVAGIVGGDLYAGGEARVDGLVRGTVFAAGDLVVSGTIDGDASANGDIEVSGRVSGSVEAFGGGATISGAVDGDTRVAGGLTLTDSAVIGGGYRAGGAVRRAPGAQVLGPATSGDSRAFPSWAPTAFKTLLVLSMVLFGALFTGLMASVAPRAIDAVRTALTRSAGASLAAGLLVGLLLVPVGLMLALPAVVMASLWVVMAPLLGVVGVIVAAAACLGGVALGTGIGATLASRRTLTAQAAVGGGAVAFVGALALVVGFRSWPILCLVGGVGALVVAWLSGAVWLTAFGTRRWPRPGDGRQGELGDEPGAGAAIPPVHAPGTAAADAAPVSSSSESTAGWPSSQVAGGSEPTVGAELEATADRDARRDAAADVNGGLNASEAPPPDRQDIDTTPSPLADPVTAGLDAAAAVAALRRIPGVTPIYAQLLVDAGVTSLEDVARAAPDVLAAAASVPGVVTVDPATAARWIELADQLRHRPA